MKMKAAIHTRYGPPEVVQVMEVPRPEPKEDEILIKVMVSTVNRTDCGFRSAEYLVSRFFSGLFRPRHNILGCEFAGVVEATGAKVTSFKAGDKVFGFNDTQFGGHAAYLTIAEKGAIATIPKGFSFAQAAPLTEGAHYALGNIRAAKIKSGQQVLVNGATGAIGSAAVQILKHLGAYVIAVCHTKDLQLVRGLGADEVIDYTQQDFTRIDKKFDVVFDAVGKSSFGKCRPLLKRKGIYVSTELGYLWQNIFLALVGPFSRDKKVIFPIPSISKADVDFLKELAASGSFRPVIDRTYPLDEITAAYRYVETGQKTGNVLIAVA